MPDVIGVTAAEQRAIAWWQARSSSPVAAPGAPVPKTSASIEVPSEALDAVRRAHTVRPDVALEAARKIALATQQNIMTHLGQAAARLRAGGEPAGLRKLAHFVGSVAAEVARLAGSDADLAHLDRARFRALRTGLEDLLGAHAIWSAAAVATLRQPGLGPEDAKRLSAHVEALAQAVATVPRDLRVFMPADDVLSASKAALGEEVLHQLVELDLSATWLDAHYEIRPRTSTRAGLYGRENVRCDLDLADRGLVLGLAFDAWRTHHGHLDLSGNQLDSPWGLPQERVRGDLRLARNSFETLVEFAGQDLRVDGDLDLRGNSALRDLSGLESIDVGGAIDLRGVPATRLPPGVRAASVRLDSDQHALIASAGAQGLIVQSGPG